MRTIDALRLFFDAVPQCLVCGGAFDFTLIHADDFGASLNTLCETCGEKVTWTTVQGIHWTPSLIRRSRMQGSTMDHTWGEDEIAAAEVKADELGEIFEKVIHE